MDPKLPWGVNQTQPGSMKTISDSKLTIFAVGQQKKTRFQKSREEKEQKVKEEEAAAAKIFDSFVASFTVEEGNAKTFIRGGEGKAGDTYKFDSKKSSSSSSSSGSSNEMDSIMQEIMSKDEKKFSTSSVSSSSSSSSTSGGNKKERQIDDFLSEIKAKQESKASGNSGNGDGYRSNRDRDSSGNSSNISGTFDPLGILSPAASGSILQVKGSFDDGDPHTTNIYVGNLAPTVTEEHLHELFGRYGDINSVKVMWPRTDEEKARKRNCGFISFMRRSDAEDAKIDLQDYVLEGNKMAVSWGKAVKINSCPFILPPPKVPLPAVTRPQPQQPTLPIPSLPQQQTTPSTSLSSPSFIPPPASMTTTAANLSSQPPPPQFLPPPPFTPPSFLSLHPPPPFTLSGNDNSIVESNVNHDAALAVNALSSSSSFPIPSPLLPPPPYPHSAATAPMPIVSRSKWDTPPVPFTAGESTTNATSSATTVTTTAQSATAATLEMSENDARIQIVPPVDKKVKELLDLTAKFVAADGNVFEKSIKLREESNPDFAFLYDLTSSDHQYYRWRVFANIMGDSERKWYAKPFKYNVHGIFIIPPEPPVTAVRESADSDSGRKKSSGRMRSGSESRSVSRGRGSKRSKYSDDEEEVDNNHMHRRCRSHSHSHSPDRNNHSHHRRHHRSSRSRSRSTDRKSSSGNGTSSSNHRDDGRSDYRRERDSKDSKAITDRVKYAGMTGAQIERARAKERSAKTTHASLTDEEYYEWKSILASLTLHKQDIKYAMGFAYDKIDDDDDDDDNDKNKDGYNNRNGPAIVSEICYLLKKSLCNKTTPPAIKIARLYLLSDILHNSAAPIKYASNFRVEIQNLLPQIFEEQLGAMRRNSTIMGRMTAYQVDERIKRLLGAWEEWSLLSYTFIMGLESAFYQSEHDYNIYQACVESSQPSKSDSSSGSSSSKIKDENQKTNDDVAAAEDENDEDNDDKDFEHYKRQAKLSGIYISPRDSKKSLKLKLQQYQNYQANKYKLNSATIAPTAQQMAARILGHSMMTGGSGMSYTTAGVVVGGSESEMEYNIDDDDIDGAPISQHTLHHLPLLSALNTQQNLIINNDKKTNINDYDEDEDIDGVPLDFADHLASLSAAHDHDTTNSNNTIHNAVYNTHNNTYQHNNPNQYTDDDDVDGAPMQDEDDDDIDGIPL